MQKQHEHIFNSTNGCSLPSRLNLFWWHHYPKRYGKKEKKMNANELADELDNMLKAIGLTDNRVPTMLRKQQAKIEALKQVLQSIANEHIELSHDKIKWQCDDHIRWAKEALK